MGPSISVDLSLDLKPSFVPESINGFLREVSLIEDVTERFHKVDRFVEKLEQEMEKIELFKRELPLSILLLKDAILVLKQESAQYRTRIVHQPVLEEFIPLRRNTSGEHIEDNTNKEDENEEDSSSDKKNWMSSVQLWSADKSPTTNTQNRNLNSNQTRVSESQKGDDTRNKLFVPVFNTYPSFPQLGKNVVKDQDVCVPRLSLLTPGIKHAKQDSISSGLNSTFGGNRISSSSSNVLSTIQTGNQSRKQRRCWSPELHRRFIDALSQLGGPQVATPKQIRELMQVDGLTNDEVKSHLQKYRLHTRRAPNKLSNSTTSCASQDSSKPRNSPSESPQGPLQFPWINTMEEEEDEKSESHSSKGHSHKSTAKTEE